MKKEGRDNDLLELIAADPMFGMTIDELKANLEPSKYVGCAPVQVETFLSDNVRPVLDRYKDLLGVKAEINC